MSKGGRVSEAKIPKANLTRRRNLAVRAAEKEKRLAHMGFGGINLSDKNRVIPGQVRGDDGASQLSECTVDDWNALPNPTVANAHALLRLISEYPLSIVFRPGLLALF